MLLADCFLSWMLPSSSSSSSSFSQARKFSFTSSSRTSLNSLSRTRTTRPCRASLITDPDSFEVGRLIGSYGFMNVTSYSGYQLGMDVENLPGNLGNLKVQDVGEGSVKISCFAGFMKEG
uniref:Uncharacterized protein MANES_09G127400 n=1 Tax=Rhizophora mucronata TaxID=61149 RepID=A0A2P2L6U1_RHIMU